MSAMLRTEIDEEGIALVTIDMPGRSMNVIDWDMGAALDEAVSVLIADDVVKGIVITSGKPSFIAGADLSIMKDFTAPGVTPAMASRKIATMGDVFRHLERGGKPVVAAAPGTALGGGLELMLACHWRVAADNPQARFGLPEVKLGLLPGAGGTQRLPRLIGIAAALPLLVGGGAMSVAEAAAAGIIDEVVAPERLIEAAKDALRQGRVSETAPWDRKGFAFPGDGPASAAVLDLFTFTNARILAETAGHYPAPKAILSCVFEGARLPIDKALMVEQDCFATLVCGDVAHAMIRTLFFARLEWGKTGRKPGDPGSDFVQAGRSAYVDEGLRLLEEGVSEALVENAATRLGMAKGPVALAREDGRPLPTPRSGNPLRPDEVRQRLLFAQVLACAGSFASGQGEKSAAMSDLDAVAGWGFPAWTGGPLSWIDIAGPESVVAQSRDLTARYGEQFQPPQVLIELAKASSTFHGQGRTLARAG
jgi:enoyl-CoA hydratase/carnithine racemase